MNKGNKGLSEVKLQEWIVRFDGTIKNESKLVSFEQSVDIKIDKELSTEK